ncbi:MAG TPA: family 16 glycosylhydrolase [Verrucomicrobiae bacterium]|nr:family 16 glycosylhydrolase [Verrucomicrobiae bacterium]
MLPLTNPITSAANLLDNPGFETGSLSGWTSFGANTYVESNSGVPHSGNNYFKIYQAFNGQVNYNGIYQDVPSAPGSTYTANGWAYTASGDALAGQNLAWLEVSFRDAYGNNLALYRSAAISTNQIANGKFPASTWIELPITNQFDPGNFQLIGAVTNLVAPEGTTIVRYQVLFQGDAFYSNGSMYFDDLSLNDNGPSSVSKNSWNIVWDDEFNGDSLDTNRWKYDIGTGPPYPGWGNNELEYYTSRTQNVYLADGFLHIRAQQESYGGQNYTSGKIKTAGLFSKKYGRFEFRAKLPSGTGFWPAIWMLPQDSPYGGWPNSGEIDIMENKGQIPNQEGGTLHFGGANGNDVFFGKNYNFPIGDSVTNFHTYVLDWTTNSISWSVDGHVYETQVNWWSNIGRSSDTYLFPAPFDQPFYIILNLAIGGNYVGNPTPDAINPNLPGEMLVDYVRVYDKTEPLELSISNRPDGKLVLSWPVEIVCHLQQLSDPAGLSANGNWSDVTGATNSFVITPGSETAVFYRLQSP